MSVQDLQYVTFINRASPVDPPIRVLPFGPGFLYNQHCYGYVVATYITFPHTYFVMASISEISDFSIQLNENSPLKCLLVKCMWQQIRN